MTRRTRASAPASAPPPAGPVAVVKPHPVAWAHALRLAKGDASRLRVKDGGRTVVVVNPPR